MNKAIAKWDKHNDCYAYTCPICEEYNLLTDIDETEVEILEDEDYIEAWCDECDEEILVKGPKYINEE